MHDKEIALIQQREHRRKRYHDLCAGLDQPSLFQSAWWLDATAGEDNWDVVLVESSGLIQAALPYTQRTRLGMQIITQPRLTQFLGPWIRTVKAKEVTRASREKDLLVKLINGLPKHHVYRQNWAPAQQNWLPFYWAGFRQTTKYTYKLGELGDTENLWRGLRENIRREIRKASGKYGIEIQDIGIDELMELVVKTFARQSKSSPYSDMFLKRVYEAAVKRGCGRVLGAVDGAGRTHAAVFLVWDNVDAYYLVGGGDPNLRSSGAASLCLWNAIKFAGTVAERFDFEGSMIEPIERYFSAFGGVRTPYFAVSRERPKALELIGSVFSILRT